MKFETSSGDAVTECGVEPDLCAGHDQREGGEDRGDADGSASGGG